MSIQRKALYLLRSAWKAARRQGKRCPSCDFPISRRVSRKWFVTTLRRCQSCDLLFRSPTSDLKESNAFYQKWYSQGYTTTLPSRDDLDALLTSAFVGSERDYSRHIRLLQGLGCKRGDRVLDFGCSWGYGVWQLRQAGFDCTGFEVSTHRAQYACDQLGVKVVSDVEELDGEFDVIFSSHVLEHVPSVENAMKSAEALLSRGGWFVALTPNGSDAARVRHPKAWSRLWGEVHPNFLDDRFYRKRFGDCPLLLATPPYDYPSIASWSSDPSRSVIMNLEGLELLALARILPPSTTAQGPASYGLSARV